MPLPGGNPVDLLLFPSPKSRNEREAIKVRVMSLLGYEE